MSSVTREEDVSRGPEYDVTREEDVSRGPEMSHTLYSFGYMNI